MTTERYNELRARPMPRSRGVVSGTLLTLLGAWGAAVPFVGPYFGFGYTPDSVWTWTAARGWYEVLPGVVVAVAGLVMVFAASRAMVASASTLAAAGGAWLVIGPQLSATLGLGSIGLPTASSTGMRALEALAYFYALGALIVFLASLTLGRMSVPGIAVPRTERTQPTQPTQPTATAEDREAHEAHEDRAADGAAEGKHADTQVRGDTEDREYAHSQH